ncbi:MAG TPA: TonB-dependent receptor [Chitinophaga sp.]|uniref:TonB-dependent receptor n=1 Tax=Chitinophaga sp. TaxID=1869181 RepID=UPI002F952C1E
MHKSLLFLLLSGITLQAAAQSNLQTIKGTVKDKTSERPLVHATVAIPGTQIGTFTDANGRYVLHNVPIGRQQVAFQYMGYKPSMIPEVLVTAGKEVVLDVNMEESINALKDVTITAQKVNKGAANNEFASVSSRSFSMEEVMRYSGGRNDPARLVTNFAGVATTDDSRNDIVVRGNAPTAVLWRMEGIPIPNPNHFAVAGNASGPVSALNTNALKNSDFYTGAFSAEYGNVTGAVFDIALREGNKDRFEKTLQLNFLSGLEAMLEGPLNKKGNGASFLVGYRYSFTSIAQSLGFNSLTTATPNYQDLVFNIKLAPGKLGTLSLFGLGGMSSIDFIGKEIDSTDFFSNTDQDQYPRSRFGVLGLKHTIDLGTRTYIRTVLSYAYSRYSVKSYKWYDSLDTRTFVFDQATTNSSWRLSSYVNSKVNVRLSVRGGVLAEVLGADMYTRDRYNKPGWTDLRNYDGSSLLLQPFVQARYRFTDKLALTGGLHGIYYGLNDTYNIEPRASLSYDVAPRQTISFSYGMHSQLQPLPVYLYQERLPGESGYNQSNRELDFTKAQHYVLGYDWRFAPSWRLKAEAYYQHLYNVPVERMPSGFSMLNIGVDFAFPEKTNLVNEGTGSNRGLELTLEKFFGKGTYLLTTASIFDARYKGSDGIERNTAFNNRAVFNVLAGREWKTGRNGRNAFTLDVKAAFSGGRYYTPVDLAASLAADEEKLDETRYNSERLSNYFRLDTRLGLRLNSAKRKLSHTFYLDLQNLTNNENVLTQRYNTAKNAVGTAYQIGFFPDFLYRLQF